MPQGFVGGSGIHLGGCNDGGAGGILPLLSSGKLKELSGQAVSESPKTAESIFTAADDSAFASQANFGAGCYWGTEKYFVKDFVKANPDAIIEGRVGFMGPGTAKANPSYMEVCSGRTGHVEVFDFKFTPATPETFEKLCRFFFQFHDPTTMNRQGNDAGTQYASVIYCYSDAQVEIASKVKSELQALLDKGDLSCFEGSVVHTDIRKSTVFYPAHAEHQEYLANNPNGYCNHRMRFHAWPTK